MRYKKVAAPCAFFVFGLMFAASAFGQDSLKQSGVLDTTQPAPQPTNLDSVRLSKKVDSARRHSRRGDTALVRQLNLMETYADNLSEMAAYFKQGLDTIEMAEGIETTEVQVKLAREGIGDNSRNPNMRNLVATRILLIELEKQLEGWKVDVSKYSNQLSAMRAGLDSMARDSAMRIIPSDSVLAQQYVTRIMDLARRFRPIDSMVSQAMINVGLLQGKVVRNLLDVKDQLGIVDLQIRNERSHYFSRKEGAIWDAGKRDAQVTNIIGTSLRKAELVLKYYFRNTLRISIIVILIFAWLWWLLARMISKLKQGHKKFVLQEFAPHLKISVCLSSMFVVVAFSQTFYSNIPMVFLEMAWLVMYIAITPLFWKELSVKARRIWMGFGVLFLWACFENLVLESSATERWLMLFASVAGILLGYYMLHVYNRGNHHIESFRFFTILFLAQEAIAVVCNIFGVYTFGRAMAVGGYFNLVIGLMFFQGIVLLREILVLLFEYFRHSDRVTSVVNLYELRQNAEKFLPYLAWVGWFVIFAKNLNFYDVMVEAFSTFFSTERKLGDMTFSFGSVAIFFISIWISTIIAQFVAFLLGGNKSQVSNIQKTRFGSSILMLKLGIISLGVIIAFAASGIPLDKITIIVGALGVGIGFGLQNVVNNLVSGIILAFEKPIEIGDQIEVGGRLGKVKEIGIRSSRLATFEGAEVIIPNGDLLSQHVVNWTLSNNHRRVEILVGVKYGSNLQLAKEILERVLQENEKVDKSPLPMVLVHQFNSSSIDFRLLFWTDIDQWISLKSEIIMAVDKGFGEAGIEIPFPQMVIHQGDKEVVSKSDIEKKG